MAAQMKEVALYFGSFNPVHIGHLALANWLCEYAGIDELWFVVSPRNPFKDGAGLMDDDLRLRLVRLATEGYPRFRVCDVEFSLSRPSYTIHTLDRLRELHPDCRFSIVMGSDNWPSFPHWVEADRIMAEHHVFLYPRPGHPVDAASLPPCATLLDAPLLDISSTAIRRALSEGRDVRYFLHPAVWQVLSSLRQAEEQ